MLVRLDGDELAADPARLIDEAGTMPLFGGRRGIWVKAGSRDFSGAVETLAQMPLRDCRVVIEAGDLKRGAALRTICERAPKIAALPCYADSDRDLARLIGEEMRVAGLVIAEDARAALIPLLGGDRRTSLSELRKLTLYAVGQARIELEDVLAVVADASSLALDAIVDAGFGGRPAEVEQHYARAQAAGIAPSRIVSVALIHATQLHRARIDIEEGMSMDEAADRVVSKAQFRRRPAVEAALRLWTAPRLERAMENLADAALEARSSVGAAAALSDPIVGRALLALAVSARRKK